MWLLNSQSTIRIVHSEYYRFRRRGLEKNPWRTGTRFRSRLRGRRRREGDCGGILLLAMSGNGKQNCKRLTRITRRDRKIECNRRMDGKELGRRCYAQGIK